MLIFRGVFKKTRMSMESKSFFSMAHIVTCSWMDLTLGPKNSGEGAKSSPCEVSKPIWRERWAKEAMKKPVHLFARWWFKIFFIFTPIWGRFPIWFIFFRWVETTNQFGVGVISLIFDMVFCLWLFLHQTKRVSMLFCSLPRIFLLTLR